MSCGVGAWAWFVIFLDPPVWNDVVFPVSWVHVHFWGALEFLATLGRVEEWSFRCCLPFSVKLIPHNPMFRLLFIVPGNLAIPCLVGQLVIAGTGLCQSLSLTLNLLSERFPRLLEELSLVVFRPVTLLQRGSGHLTPLLVDFGQVASRPFLGACSLLRQDGQIVAVLWLAMLRARLGSLARGMLGTSGAVEAPSDGPWTVVGLLPLERDDCEGLVHPSSD